MYIYSENALFLQKYSFILGIDHKNRVYSNDNERVISIYQNCKFQVLRYRGYSARMWHYLSYVENALTL